MDEVYEGKVYETTNYEIFKTIKSNRPISRKYVEDLCKSIDANNLLPSRPIIVNDCMEVIDGQHRLEAARMLNLPIYYIIINGAAHQEIATLNSCQHNWNAVNYLEMYVELGFVHYIKLKKFIEKHKLDLWQAKTLFMDGKHVESEGFNKKFFSGKFIFDINPEELERILDKYLEFKSVYATNCLKPKIEKRWANSRSTFKAFVLFCQEYFDEIDWPLFFSHEKLLCDRIGNRSSLAGYRAMLAEIYNWKSRGERIE